MPGTAVILGECGRSGSASVATAGGGTLAGLIERMIAPLIYPGHETAILADDVLGVAAAQTAPRHTGGAALGLAGGGAPGEWEVAALVEGEPVGLPKSGLDLDNASRPSRANRLAALYAARGAEALEGLRGHWAVVVADRRRGLVTVANDPFGIRPLYRMRSPGGGWLVATNPAALLSYPDVRREIDPAGLADYLAFGYPVGNHALFAGMERLPAATILQFSADGLRERRYWRPVMRPDRHWNEADLEAIRCAFNQNVLDLVEQGEPASLALSGGGDSRAILSALMAGGLRFETLTHSIAGASDAQIAAELAEVAGVRHHFYETKGEDIAPHVVEGVRMLAGQVAGIEAHPLAFLPEYPGFTRAMLTGLGGNVFKGSFLSGEQDAQQRSLPDLARWLAVRHNHQIHTYSDFEPLLTADWCAALRELPERSVLLALEQMSTDTPVARRSVVFYVEERVCKYLAKGDNFVRREIEARHPFMDRELLTQAWRIPSEVRARNIIPSYIITRNAPTLLDVHVTRAQRGGGLPLRPYAATPWGRFTTYLSQKQETLRERREKQVTKVPNYLYADWLRSSMRPLVEEVLLDPRTLSRPYFRAETVRKWVAEHMAGQNRTDKLSVLLSLELTMRAFIDAAPGTAGSAAG